MDAPEGEVVEAAPARGVLSGEVAARLGVARPTGDYTALRANYSPTATIAERHAGMLGALRAAGLVEGAFDVAPAPKVPERRFQVLDAIYRGLSNRQVMAELGMTESTMKSHQGNLHTQFGVDGRVKLVVEAVRCGLLPAIPSEGE